MPLSRSQWEQLPSDVKARYPKPGNDRGLWLIGIVAAAVVAAFVGLGYEKYVSLPAVGKLTGFEILDNETVRTDFEVNREPGETITCALRAQDDRRVDVGYAWVEIAPSSDRRTAVSYLLATRKLAVLVEVLGCSVGKEVTGVPLPQIEPGTQLPEQPEPGRLPPNL
jgi:hypothetical protein